MIANFYNNLLGIEITILGIITAGIFVFIQILHSNFSHKDLTLSLRRISIFVYFLLSALLIVLTGIGSLHFAMSPHDLFPHWNVGIKAIFESDIALVSIFGGLLFSASLGIYIIFESIRLLNPFFLMRRYLETLDNETIKRFLYNRYGVPEPFRPINIIYTIQGVDETEEEIKAKEAEIQGKQKKFEDDVKKCDQLKTESENSPDVFEGFENLLIRAMSQGDRSSVKKGLASYVSKMKDIILSVDSTFPIQHLATYERENLNIFLESCRKHNTQSFSPQIIRTSHAIATSLMKNNSDVVEEILKGWKAQADLALKYSDKLLFRAIIKSYQDIGDIIFSREDLFENDRNDVLDTIFRHLGWIVERLLSQKGIEEKPLMYDDDYEDEFGIIYNTLFHFDDKYRYNRPSAYPLIFFDAIHCLFDGLLEVYQKSKEEKLSTLNKRGEIKDWLFSCAYVYSSFAEKAIFVSNGDGFALAGIRLLQLYRTAEIANEEDLTRNILELIVRLAIQGAMNPEKLVGNTYGAGKSVEDAEDIIIHSQYSDTIRSAVFENYIKLNEGDHNKKIAYIHALGVKMGTNFGLNLSPKLDAVN
jgi:hypothetical protein